MRTLVDVQVCRRSSCIGKANERASAGIGSGRDNGFLTVVMPIPLTDNIGVNTAGHVVPIAIDTMDVLRNGSADEPVVSSLASGTRKLTDCS